LAQLQDPHYASHLAYRLESANLLGHVVTRTRKRDVKEWSVLREVHAEGISLSPIERRFYDTVTDVVRQYCARRAAHEGFLSVMPQRQMSSSMPAALRHWRRRQAVSLDEVFEDLGVDDAAIEMAPEDPGPLLGELMRRCDELGDLDELQRHDSKYRRLKECLKSFRARHTDGKVIIFAYFRQTLDYLYERLAADGHHCYLLKGGAADKDGTIRDFRDHEGATVLLSSEVGSEGIDLQFAWVVINYDLPWNPMRIEQRIGRVDRLGQQSPKVVVWNLFCEGTIDARIYRRLFERLNIFTRALGSLEQVLGQKIRGLTMELLRNELSPAEEEQRIDQTERALENIQREEENLEENAAHLVAYGDYILNHVQAARELNRRIDGKDIQSYVLDFFSIKYSGCEFRQLKAGSPEFDISLSNNAKHALETFLRDQRLEGHTQLVRNDLRHVRCRFENSVIPKRDGRVEVISQFHPIVRFVGQQIAETRDFFHPVVAIQIPSSALARPVADGTYVFSVQRWSIRGLQDVERLFFVVATVEERVRLLGDDVAEQVVGIAASEGTDWLGAQQRVDLKRVVAIVNNVCLARSDEEYERYLAETKARNDDRADVQERTLERHVRSQMRTLEEVLEKHRQRGRTGLASATEGRMRALKNRTERRKMQIAERRELSSRTDEICLGIINITSA